MKKNKEIRELIRRIDNRYKGMLKTFNGDYDKVIQAMEQIYDRLTVPNREDAKTLNGTYKITEIANSPSATLKKIKANHAFGFYHNFILSPEIYFYDKAPDGVILALSIYDYKYDKRCPIRIDLFVKREGGIL